MSHKLIDIRSESWLDLSKSQPIERPKRHHSVSRTNSQDDNFRLNSKWQVNDNNNRIIKTKLAESDISSIGSSSSIRARDDHLLIRWRQESFELKRRSSSVSLGQSSTDQISLAQSMPVYSIRHEHERTRKKEALVGFISSKLERFKRKLENRRRRSSRRFTATPEPKSELDQSNSNSNNRASSIARSLSSFSDRLNYLRGSWSKFLANYGEQHNQLDRFDEWTNYSPSRIDLRLKNQLEEHRERVDRRRLTESWIQNHHQFDRPKSLQLEASLIDNLGCNLLTRSSKDSSSSTTLVSQQQQALIEGPEKGDKIEGEGEEERVKLKETNLLIKKRKHSINDLQIVIGSSDYWSGGTGITETSLSRSNNSTPFSATCSSGSQTNYSRKYLMDKKRTNIANKQTSSSSCSSMFKYHHPSVRVTNDESTSNDEYLKMINQNQNNINNRLDIPKRIIERDQSVEAQLTSTISATSSSLFDFEQSKLNDYYYCDDYDDYAIPCDDNICRLDRSQVELVQMIGEGQKGFVFLGKLQSRDGRQIIDVAIKTLKYETHQLIEKLMQEAAMMRQFEHPHIIKFIGVCPETPALIAMELAKFGELKQYLKANKSFISISQLVLFTFQISTALSYLESKSFVHRDVAARNVLVCSHSCVKLADFGLSRNLQPESIIGNQFNQQKQHISPSISRNYIGDQNRRILLNSPSPDISSTNTIESDDKIGHYVSVTPGKLPVRWLAPESLAFRRFTSASDVWMFAVCSWEIFHLGLVRPWPSIRNNQVLSAIEAGQRLSRPLNCPTRLYQLMLQCWSYAPAQRPKFRDIKQDLWSIYLNERAKEEQSVSDHFAKLEQQQIEQRQRHQQMIALAAARRQQQFEQEQQLIEMLYKSQDKNEVKMRQARMERQDLIASQVNRFTQPPFKYEQYHSGSSRASSIGRYQLSTRNSSQRSPLPQSLSTEENILIEDRRNKRSQENSSSRQGHRDARLTRGMSSPAPESARSSCIWLSDEEERNGQEVNEEMAVPEWARGPTINPSYDGCEPQPIGLVEPMEAMRISAPRELVISNRKTPERANKNKKPAEDEEETRKKLEREKEQQNRLALHRRLLGHIRLTSSSSKDKSTNSNTRKSSKLEISAANTKAPVETVDQSLELLASLISEKNENDSKTSCKLSPQLGYMRRNTDNVSCRPKSCEIQLREQWKQIGREFVSKKALRRSPTMAGQRESNQERLIRADYKRAEDLRKSRTASNLILDYVTNV